MTDTINTGGAAFPVTYEGGQNNGESPYFHEGMTLRDYAAVKIMAAMISSSGFPDFIRETGTYSTSEDVRMNLATAALLYADAFVAARGGAR
ncbi:CO dehydrogenase/acetyl-CoA synthase gamma subunit (corrinoid Fe-S protein) [Paenochrobactrum gallinarii]|uniref:CO dehydrogenase/acetyl-CoA synthase gamma subunit (Corrinoid Fe-S protein) n=1 Tax=Paenochrobactrum gallinarii TaxID=643673 RepID=A0A841LXN6_9HYPH|nr:hypothetical protein [Paenochrobactrum gallinarii]MBB6262116.1 CO dehydrogenase/acetyl-CoA synthase gamma subunit (corrinoid Fe-S protein) [Paenochrobactrum gallinarii]